MTTQVQSLVAVLQLIASMADSHIEDVISGISEGIYDASDNADLNEKAKALKAFNAFIAVYPSTASRQAQCESIVQDILVSYGDAVKRDDEINGGDAVEKIVEWVISGREALQIPAANLKPTV